MENRYEEALAKARTEYEKARKQGYTWLMVLLEGMFPDLKESEDERIRKHLIARLKPLAENDGIFDYLITKDKVLAYLEKQKEHQNCINLLARILKDSSEGFRRILKKKGLDYTPDDGFWSMHASGYSKQHYEEFLKSMDDMMEKIPIEETYEYRKGFEAGLKQKESLHIPETCKENPDSFTDEHPNIIYTEMGEEFARQKEADWNKKLCLTCQEYEKGFERGRLEGCTAGYNRAMKEMEQQEQKPTEERIEDRKIECPFRAILDTGFVGCERYSGVIGDCDGRCSWVVDYTKLKEIHSKTEQKPTLKYALIASRVSRIRKRAIQ